MEMPFIPFDILQNHILIRLPVKSLLRFRRVCKSWSTLIADPQFVKQHLHQIESEPTSEFHHQGVLFLHGEKLCSLQMDRNRCSSFEELSIPSCSSGLPIDSSNSCNGLILLRFTTDDWLRSFIFVLLNPASRTHSFISYPSFLLSGRLYVRSYGLGYDSCEDDYKIVLIYNSGYNWDQIEVCIYSRNSGSWKDIREISRFSLNRNRALYLNGLLYWFVRMADGKSTVVYFDWMDEVFKILPGPFPGYFQVGLEICSLTAWRGCLCLSICSEFDAKIWILKEQAWDLIIRIPFDRFKADRTEFLFFTNEGENCLFKRRTGCIANYRCRENKWELVMATWPQSHYSSPELDFEGSGAVTFIRSLVSPSLRQDTTGNYFKGFASPKSARHEPDDMGTNEEVREEQRLWLNSVDKKEARTIKRWKDREGQKRRMQVLDLFGSSMKNRTENKVKNWKRDIERTVEEYLSEQGHK